jgi:hypothetical protein
MNNLSLLLSTNPEASLQKKNGRVKIMLQTNLSDDLEYMVLAVDVG